MSAFGSHLTVRYDDAVELDLYGILIADANGTVLQVDGALNSDIKVGARLTRDFLPFIGMDDDIVDLINRPGERLRMPKVALGKNDVLVNLTLYWAGDKQRFLMIAMESVEASAEMLPAIRLTRTNRLLTEQLEVQRKHFEHFYDLTPFLGLTLFPDGQISASTVLLRETLGLSDGEGGGHAEALLIKPIINALKAADAWDMLWRGEMVSGVKVSLAVADGKSQTFTISGTRIIDAETGLKEASLVLSPC